VKPNPTDNQGTAGTTRKQFNKLECQQTYAQSDDRV
jgi:hypothetical protein